MVRLKFSVEFAVTLVLLATVGPSPVEPSTTTTTTPSTALAISVDTVWTCPSRSFNHITQTLPRQCYTDSWKDRASDHAKSLTGESIRADSLSSPTAPSTSVLPNVEADLQSTTQTPSGIVTPDSQSTSISSPESESSTVQNLVTQQAVPEHAALSQDSQTVVETESPLDNANFLSFEDWKRQNLAKVGQSVEGLGQKDRDGSESRRRPSGIHQALDALGEDIEIDIDFGGFVNAGPSQGVLPMHSSNDAERSLPQSTAAEAGSETTDSAAVRARPKDAGKTCKERTNYASYDCAATTLKTNAECKSSSAVLVENKDSYMLNICSAKNKFFIVEMCDNILIDTVVLANFEFFSSMFRTFRVSVSDRYPVKMDKWKELGTFEAQNGRHVQAFLVENPLIWARYLRIEILSHYGNEYYCPISLLRVHGTTMMEEFNNEIKSGSSDDPDIEVLPEVAIPAKTEPGNEPAAMIATPAIDVKTLSQDIIEHEIKTVSEGPAYTASNGMTRSSTSFIATATQSHLPGVNTGTSPRNATGPDSLSMLFPKQILNDQVCTPDEEPEMGLDTPSSSNINVTNTITPGPQFATAAPVEIVSNITNDMNRSASDSKALTSLSELTTAINSAVASDVPKAVMPAISPHSISQDNSTVSAPSSTTKVMTSAIHPPAANPTTQESFFKSVHKRLQLLEANSTLSLQYIEEQSRILRDAFTKVEKRQLAKTTSFLESLNGTVLNELREFRLQYDQIWQSTILELSSQRQQSEHEVVALSARLGLLADEIVFQKRIAILQFLLVIVCLALVIFSKHGSISGITPLLNHTTNSKSFLNLHRQHTSHLETPPTSPSASRPSSRYSFFRGFAQGGSPPAAHTQWLSPKMDKSPRVEYSPPTPESQSSMEHDLSDYQQTRSSVGHDHDLDAEVEDDQIRDHNTKDLEYDEQYETGDEHLSMPDRRQQQQSPQHLPSPLSSNNDFGHSVEAAHET